MSSGTSSNIREPGLLLMKKFRVLD